MRQDELTKAIHAGNATLVSDLLTTGANPNDVDSRGWTPLAQAAEMENLEIIEILLTHNADPNQPSSDGTTPLHAAVDIAIDGTIQSGGKQGDEPVLIIKRLLAAGANVELRNNHGETPLDWARNYRSKKVIAVLLGQL